MSDTTFNVPTVVLVHGAFAGPRPCTASGLVCSWGGRSSRRAEVGWKPALQATCRHPCRRYQRIWG